MISNLYNSLNTRKSKKLKYITNTSFNDYDNREEIYREKVQKYKNVNKNKYLKYLTKLNI